MELKKERKKNRKKREKELLVTEVDRGGSWEKREKLAWRARAALKVESSSDGMGSDDGGMPGKEKRNERGREREIERVMNLGIVLKFRDSDRY